MRRYYIWYCLALGWFLAALVGLLRHHAPQAVPAAIFALLFAIIGFSISRRDAAARKRSTPGMR